MPRLKNLKPIYTLYKPHKPTNEMPSGLIVTSPQRSAN